MIKIQTTSDASIREARKRGLKVLNAIPAAVSVIMEIEGQELRVYRNGDVDAPDGYRYSVALVSRNGLVGIEA